ncbi:MAG: hypothetical protein ACUVWX_01140 [Kiritimatiellia bacterium]
MTDVVELMTLKWLVGVAEQILTRIDRKTGKVCLPGVQYRHQHVSYPLAWLYVTPFEGNTLFGRPEVLELALAAAEYKFTYQTERGGYDEDDEKEQGDEWQAYFLLRTVEVLGQERMGLSRWRKWCRSLTRYTDCHGARPFFFSAPNHECWKMLTLDLAGRILERPDLVQLADFGTTQLMRYQLAPGFWDENRHHGPSMSYNYVMAEPLYMYWLATRRQDVGAALRRLLKFTIRYALPDGSTSGAMDGRVPYTPGRLSQAMSSTACGRRLNHLAWENWVALQRGSEVDLDSLPDAGSATAWTVDFLRFRRKRGAATPLGQESDGYFAEDHDGNFHALARRQGPWHLILSGTFSDIPKETDNVYRLERQNRIDLWHERTGLIVGGGSTHRRSDRHLANLFVDTDYFGVADFGLLRGRWPETVRAMYYPRLIAVGKDGEVSLLELIFGHATGTFRCQPASSSEFHIEPVLRCTCVRRAFAGIPIVIPRDTEILVDGQKPRFDRKGQIPVRGIVEVLGSLRGARWEVRLPRGARAKLNRPLQPGYSQFSERIRLLHRQWYVVALLAVELPTDESRLSGPVVLRVH